MTGPSKELHDEMTRVLCGDKFGGRYLHVRQAIEITQALMPLLERREREAGARALREAADDLGIGVMYEGGYIDTVVLPDALRDRADAITNGGATTEEAE